MAVRVKRNTAFATLLLLLLLFCTSEHDVVSAADDQPVVSTDKGEVRGRRVPLTGVDTPTALEVDEYLGIPYAKPPLGALRFVGPQEADPWSDVYEATSLPSTCYQVLYASEFTSDPLFSQTNLSEDCLYLNVWTPAAPRPRSAAAVLVWIYGGGFNMGSSSTPMYDGKLLASLHGVVVVSMQYRVGALGFLSLGIGSIPGNAGLLDQRLAIKWVHENIHAFGGDPDRITLFGESAGGASVSHHLISTDSRDYFTRAIMQSGTANAPWATMPMANASSLALRLADTLGCPTDNGIHSTNLVSCLQNAEAVNVTGNLAPSEYLPVIDGTFLTDSPEALMGRGQFYNTSIMVGANANEGSMFVSFLLPHMFPATTDNFTITPDDYRSAMQTMFATSLNDLQIEAAIFYYTDWNAPDDSDKLVIGVDGALGDTWFVCPAMEFARTYAEANQRNTYVYWLTHRAWSSSWPEWYGVAHADDLQYVFGIPLHQRYNAPEVEKTLSRDIMTYWTNFAKTGDPNRDDNNQHTPSRWPPRTAQGMEYLELSTGSHSQGQGPRTTQCAAWNHYIFDLHPLDPLPCDNDASKAIGASHYMPFLTSLIVVLAYYYCKQY